MRHLVFFIAYLYFLYNDLKKKEISLIAIGVYALVALITIFLTKEKIDEKRLIDIIFSIFFGLIIYMLSYFSKEGIGIADGMYFVINGLLLTLKENIILFLSALFVAFIVGIIFYITKKKYDDVSLPFIPCMLPVIIGYIVCIA